MPRTVFGVERCLDIPPHVELETKLDTLELFYGGCNCEHGWFDSCIDNTKLHYRRWLPHARRSHSNDNTQYETPPPKAIIVYAHGIQTHSGNTAFRAQRLNQQGYACYCHDFFGHGLSEGKRWVIPRSYQNNLKDYCTFVHLVAEQHPDTPLILMGESYGALLTLHLARQFQDHPGTAPACFDSIILTSPPIQVSSLPPKPILLALRYVFAPLFPTWIPFFMPNPVEVDDDDEDEEENAWTLSKQLHLDSTGPLCLRTASEIIHASSTCRTKTIPGFCVPYCLVHGTDDATCPIAGAKYLWKETRRSSLRKDEREYHPLKGAGHDVFEGNWSEKTLKITFKWISKRLTKIQRHKAKTIV